jgi:hypothetical protein
MSKLIQNWPSCDAAREGRRSQDSPGPPETACEIWFVLGTSQKKRNIRYAKQHLSAFLGSTPETDNRVRFVC